jgi:signal transduction histidine kinase
MNPGHNPATFRFPETTLRRVRLECSKIWKKFPNYPAFLALSEIQFLHGETNVAEGLAATSSEAKGIMKAHHPMVWSEESLTNGHGPQGKLVSRREWLLLLNQRLDLETRQQALLMEAASIVTTLQTRLFHTFGGLGTLAILALFVLPIRYRMREHHHLRILRQRIADDLHDEVGANLSSIAGSTELLSEITEQQTHKQRELLSDITRTARKTAEETRTLIHFLEHKKFEGDLANQFLQAANQTLSGIPFDLRLADMDAFNPLPPILKWDLLLFYKEALHNILKHADADRVEIKTYASTKHLHLTILDNGKGLAYSQKPKHMLIRAKKLKAELTLTSPPKGGTKVQLNIPKKRVPPWKKSSHS